MPTVSRILQITPPSCMLANNRVAKGALFGPTIDPKLPITIYMVYKVLKTVYDKDPNYTGVRVVADYLYELIQKYAFRAAAIVDNNTGGQIAPPSGITVPNPYDFEVTDSSFIPTGDDSVSIDLFKGYNVNFSRGGIMQNTTNLGDGSSYYSWNIVTGLFTIYPEASEGELFRIMPDVYGAGGTTTIIDNTPTTLVISDADMTGGTTYDNPDIITWNYMLFVQGYNSEWQFEGAFFDYTATGFVITAAGFDAANFGNIIIQRINS